MSRGRTWNLRLNLDELNALSASLYADSDRALALQGIMLGANGGPLPAGVPDAFRRGWDLGASMHREAVDFQAAQAERGRASASKRRDATGSAQPARIQPPFEPPFEPPFDKASNLTTIHNPQSAERQSAIPEQRASARDGSGRIHVSEWEPLQEHRELAAIRNADCDLQLARFRERNVGQIDTDQGWSVRFRQWIGRSRPESRVSALSANSPTLDEWMQEAAKLDAEAHRAKMPEWPADLAEALWHDQTAKGWRYASDWRSALIAAHKRFLGLEMNHTLRNQRRK